MIGDILKLYRKQVRLLQQRYMINRNENETENEK